MDTRRAEHVAPPTLLIGQSAISDLGAARRHSRMAQTIYITVFTMFF
jgi:hypothetical protein